MQRLKERIFIIRNNLYRLFLVLGLLFLNVSGMDAQQSAMKKQITLDVSGKPLSEVLKQISQQTSLHFFYDQEVVKKASPVTLSVKNGSLEDVLSLLEKRTNLLFKVTDSTITITRKTTSSKNINNSPFTLSGTVKDIKGQSVIGANVSVEGATQGTITDLDGNFTLSVKDGDDIKVSYIGFLPQTLQIKDRKRLDIILKENTKQLEEVVVVGYGTQKKVNLTGSISTLSKELINQRPVSNLTSAMKGLDPAVYIKMNSGTQDAGYSIDIRGSISVNGGSPLLLVDGVQSSLNMINPNDVESISILKDASAASIYGAKASAGVVLITTKSGHGEKAKATINYNGRWGWKKMTTSTDFNTQGYESAKIADLFYNARYGMNYTNYTEAEYQMLWERRNDKTENPDRPWIITQEDGTYRYYANTDWYGYLWNRTMAQQDHNVSITGGNDKVNYYISGRYYTDEGIFKIVNDTYDTYSFRTKLDAKLTPWLKYQGNVNFFSSLNKFNGYSDRNKTYYMTRVHGLASFAPTNPDGSAVYISNHSNTSSTLGDGVMAALIQGKHRNKNEDKYITINNQLTGTITKDLLLTGQYSYTFRNRKYANRCVNVPYSFKAGEILWLNTGQFVNNYQEQHYNVNNNNVNLYLTYSHLFNQAHNLVVVGGSQVETYGSNLLKIKRQDLLSDDLDSFSLSNGELESLTQSIGEYRTLGFFSRLNYDYKGKYLVEVSGRYDGSSRFSAENRWGFFPSGSIGWRMSEESFWSGLSNFWDNSKLRFSIGSLGNQQVDYYAYIDEISTNGSLNYSLDGTTKVQYAYESDPISSDLTWETVTTYDWGIDWGFLNNRLNVTADYYLRDTRNMLTTSITLPGVYGANAPKANCANLRTNGWELKIGWNDQLKFYDKPLFYSINASIGDYKTKITKYKNDEKLLSDYYEGMTLGEIWGYKIDGLFQTDAEAAAYTKEVNMDLVNTILLSSSVDNYYRAGDLKYLDLDGNNIISPGAGTVNDPGDKRIIGNSLPRYSYTIGGSFSWNNLDFSVLFSGVGKQDWYPTTEAEMFWFAYSRPYSTYMAKNFLSQCWTDDNPNTYFPRLRGYQTFTGGQLYYSNDRYLQNIAYCRLKNLTLGYTLPVLKNVFQKCRVYFSGENLCLWSPLKKHTKYIDPEQVTSSSEYKSGSAQAYGFTKSFSVGLDITF